MPLTRIKALNNKIVTVITHEGTPVAVGRVHVSIQGSSAAVELAFKTELTRCTLILLPEEIDVLCDTQDSKGCHYSLPEGNKLWLRGLPAPKSTGEKADSKAPHADLPIVETYPLPPDSRLGASVAPSPSKEGLAPAESKAASTGSGMKPISPIRSVTVIPVRPFPARAR